MSALRKAGVWLGLVEEEDEIYEVEDEFAEDDDVAARARPRSLGRPSDRDPRSEYRRAESRGVLGLGADRDTARRDSSARDSGRRSADDARLPESRLVEPRSDARLPEPRERESRPEREPWGPDRPGRTGETARDSYELQRDQHRDDTRERGSVRQLSRATPAPPGQTTYPTQDNLALAPQVQLRERAVVSEDKSRRYQITTLHPTTYGEARTIGEHFRDGYPVIMNLTEMDEPDAKRLVDFAAGLAFGTRGSMERVTNRVFLLSPPNIQVSAEDKARIAENGFFDQG